VSATTKILVAVNAVITANVLLVRILVHAVNQEMNVVMEENVTATTKILVAVNAVIIANVLLV